jgi:CubicO group peptidase (beta-lactamase class C family)
MRQLFRGFVVLSVVVASMLLSTVAAQEQPLNGLDDYITQAMTTFHVPGVAVAIVKDGKVVLARGYGFRRLGEPAKVDEHTLFAIGSNTKAFTTAALAMLVDEGKIQWDDRVFERLPGFQMYDPYVSHEMTIRDLLTHRSGMGLGEGDLLIFPPSDRTSSEIIRRLRYMKPASSFRSGFAYDNLLYIAAGEIIPAITGKAWNETIRERIFKPLNMNDSNTSITEFRPGTNFATPHSLVEGKLTAISFTSIDNAAPAGAINSSAADMAKWVIAQLDGGAIRGIDQRLFSDRCHREMWSAQTVIGVEEPPPGLAAARTNFLAYGLGWFLSDYRGRKEVSHTGGVPGYVSRVTMIPDLRLGVVVLTNQESGMMFNAVTDRVLDRYMDVPDYDWVKADEEVIAKERADAAAAENKQSNTRALDSKLSLPLEKYAGNYEDAWYGNVAIAMEEGKLVMRFSHSPALTGDMEHWQYDTFKVKWRDRSLAADAFATFTLNADGAITEVLMKPVSPMTDFSFDFQDLSLVPVKAK